jgi:hypothetical protein
MIFLRFRGGLGNQLFQFATLYAAARRTEQTFAYADLPYKWTSRLRILCGRLFKPPIFPLHEIEKCFPAVASNRYRNIRLAILFQAAHSLNYKTLSERAIDLGTGIRPLTGFDDRFLNPRNCEIAGFFQSQDYFLDYRQELLELLKPSTAVQEECETIFANLQVVPSQCLCLHVRRGDYLQMRNNGRPDGWALPLSYYRRAIAEAPSHLKLIVISDDQEWCRSNLAEFNPVFLPYRTSAITDLWLLSRCHHKILSNSSFSWWGAWLGESTSGNIYYPQHFLGFAYHRTLPEGIVVPEWHPIEFPLN